MTELPELPLRLEWLDASKNQIQALRATGASGAGGLGANGSEFGVGVAQNEGGSLGRSWSGTIRARQATRGPFWGLRQLRTLLLHDNELHDLRSVVEVLKVVENLSMLTLLGNPVARERDYRLYVIWRLPSLQILDRHEVTEKERVAAAEMFGPQSERGSKAFGRFKSAGRWGNSVGFGGVEVPVSEITARRVKRELKEARAGMRAAREQRRQAGDLGASVELDAAEERERMESPADPEELEVMRMLNIGLLEARGKLSGIGAKTVRRGV